MENSMPDWEILLSQWQKHRGQTGYSPAFVVRKDSFKPDTMSCVLVHIEHFQTRRIYGEGVTELDAVLDALKKDKYILTPSQIFLAGLT